MRMKHYILLVVNIAVSSAVSMNPNGPVLVNVGEEKDIPEANKDLHDDILEAPNIQRSAVIDDNSLWTSPVPYVLEKDLEMNAKGLILRAFDQFRLKSCIDFKPRDSEEYYISVQKRGGCFSYVGRTFSGGQVLSIGRFCDRLATVEHEFLHALGFYHEQSRYDRDDYVTIAFENIIKGRENNFHKIGSEKSTTQGVPYDYLSVMHYGKNFFSNGNGSTVITKDPKFQDVIGQRLEMSPCDVMELNLLYKCNSSIAFKMHCGFSDGTMCQMKHCSRTSTSWELVQYAQGGPTSDHTSLPDGNGDQGQGSGHFMHASTASGQEGDSAWLETQRMSLNRECPSQCLQFYYYHSGNHLDELNIWMREFQDEQDSTGTLRLMAQITGTPTSHWQLQHVPLNATKNFQVEFEVRKGPGNSKGGFSIDDINLSETECPHLTMQMDEFEKVLNTTEFSAIKYSGRQYSREGYAYRIATIFYGQFFGMYVQLVSGDYDDQLEWPCPYRQVTFKMLDQNPNIQLQMSSQFSLTSDPNLASSDGRYYWDNPRKIGTEVTDEYDETFFAGFLIGSYSSSLERMKSKEFLKGGSAIFVFSFQDLTPLVNGSVLPCPQIPPVRITNPPRAQDNGPCSLPSTSTTTTPQTTDDNRSSTTTSSPPQTTDDKSIFGFSPNMVASPLLTLLLALMLLTR
ncbi:meprin A subunit beta-like [Mugil cephalus]|uniref:meprin A subunit beta-like n=1 Tax=Mugil cephalus TaxID=48193 RepID=UPI001FB5B438|nr:meprin A subunit beta-like [Mugil cephalus]XP_047455697.1 meprin A subunit beta-like [Mugil cephalus]